ncbi:hypothetical protein LDENG_00264890, partial [Lucifuga dentata]
MTVWYSVHRTSDAAPNHLSISYSILPSLVNKTPRCLNSSVWGSDSPLTWREQSTFFLQSIMVSDLEVLILIL